MEPQRFTGRSEEDAVAKACAEMGLLKNEIEYNVIDPGGKSLFGLKNKDVVIEVRRRDELDEEQLARIKQDKQEEQPREERKSSARRSRRRDGGRNRDRGDDEEDFQLPKLDPEQEKALLETKAAHSKEVAHKIADTMGLELEIETKIAEDGVVIEIRGDQADELMGRSGEILEAFQFLLHKIVNRFPDDRRRLSVDIQGYRAQKEKALMERAQRLAEQVMVIGKPIAVGPMSARDRRIIHMAIKEISGVHTRSEGEGIHRSVIILPPRQPRNKHRDDRQEQQADDARPDSGETQPEIENTQPEKEHQTE